MRRVTRLSALLRRQRRLDVCRRDLPTFETDIDRPRIDGDLIDRHVGRTTRVGASQRDLVLLGLIADLRRPRAQALLLERDAILECRIADRVIGEHCRE